MKQITYVFVLLIFLSGCAGLATVIADQLKPVVKQQIDSRLLEEFDEFDKDLDGKLSREETKKIVTHIVRQTVDDLGEGKKIDWEERILLLALGAGGFAMGKKGVDRIKNGNKE